MFKPVGHRVIIKPDPIETKTESGIILEYRDDNIRMEQAAQMFGTVVAIGPTAWFAYDKDCPEWEPWAKVGDRVAYAKFGGKFLKDPETDEEFVIINDSDLTVVVEE